MQSYVTLTFVNEFAGILRSERHEVIITRIYRAIILAKSFTFLRITREFNVSTANTRYSGGTICSVAYMVNKFFAFNAIVKKLSSFVWSSLFYHL